MSLLGCGWPCVYVLCSCMNVNLSMCKHNVFKTQACEQNLQCDF